MICANWGKSHYLLDKGTQIPRAALLDHTAIIFQPRIRYPKHRLGNFSAGLSGGILAHYKLSSSI